MFDLRQLNDDLPDQFIYGVEYDTNTWGYNPIGAPSIILPPRRRAKHALLHVAVSVT